MSKFIARFLWHRSMQPRNFGFLGLETKHGRVKKKQKQGLEVFKCSYHLEIQVKVEHKSYYEMQNTLEDIKVVKLILQKKYVW